DGISDPGDWVDVEVAPAAGAELEPGLGGAGVHVGRVVAEDDALDATILQIGDVHRRIPGDAAVVGGDGHDLVFELVGDLPGGGVLLVHEADHDVAVGRDRRIGEEALVTSPSWPGRSLVGGAVGRVEPGDL